MEDGMARRDPDPIAEWKKRCQDLPQPWRDRCTKYLADYEKSFAEWSNRIGPKRQRDPDAEWLNRADKEVEAEMAAMGLRVRDKHPEQTPFVLAPAARKELKLRLKNIALLRKSAQQTLRVAGRQEDRIKELLRGL